MARTLSAPRARRNGQVPARRALALLALLAGPGCSAEPLPSAAAPVVARALAPLALAELRLLPSAIAAELPSPLTPPAPPAPAFDAAFVGALGPGDSWSIGTTSRGYLVGAKALPDDVPGLVVRESSRQRGALWGSAAFVDALARAARHVAERYPGSRLFAGDLSLRNGGNFAPHASHASGRDVDLSFYVRDPDGDTARGAPHDGPEMRWVDADGRVTGASVVFDAERNWALVEALLRDPTVQVQWVFVASHLEPLLLAAGRAAGADDELLKRAAAVLQQPGDSSPHADHFHVRVYCTEAERLQGCLDAPPFHAWVDRFEPAMRRWIDGLLPFLADPRGAAGEEFRFALERLVRANATEALPRLDALAQSASDDATRALVTDAIDFLRGRRTPAAWARWRPENVGD
ncbi:MAG: penicillin-insensitive murein endopeptidase [Myxococcota bacterium]